MTGTRSSPLLTTLSSVKTAPKWSFRGRSSGAGEAGEKNPGPGTYAAATPDKSKYSRAPAAMFGTSSRDGPGGGFAPGPGQYNSKSVLSEGTPKYGFGSSQRSGLARRSQTPGPGSYDVRKGMDGLQISLSGRFGESRRARTPGPGAYSSNDSTYEQSPKFCFGTSLRPDLQLATKNPGPGTYQAMSALGGNVVFQSPPKYSMKPRREMLKTSAHSTPGPGAHGGQFTTFGY
eukprot:GEMP01080980.1.p1 GENE.GEMP01080980.1~~GEMP01080980.1.p1  ORF type:complete len:232 (+),score=41.16 GEMP01080980.1:122-817(+)